MLSLIIKKNIMKNYFLHTLAILLIATGTVSAQDYTSLLRNKLLSSRSSEGMTQQDLEGLTIYNQSTNRRSGVEHVYAIQKYNGIEIFNSIVTATFRGEELIHMGDKLQTGVASRVRNASPVLTPIQAATKAASLLGAGTANFSTLERKSSQEVILDKGGVSADVVPVKLMYQLTDTNEFRLVWDLSIHMLDQPNWYSVRVDAENGEILSENDWYATCTFGPTESHSHSQNATKSIAKSEKQSSFGFKAEEINTALNGPQYNVYPLPIINPNVGTPQLITDPSDPEASPFGWHDTDGVEGADFTITRGNNVYAQDDVDRDNLTFGDSPEGGADLVFDFEYNLNTEPENIFDATTTNLFYLNNIVHDVMYYYGFDEASGNFQETNYTGEGFGNDFVIAQSQDPRFKNNASFATPPEAGMFRPVMMMHLFDEPELSLTLNVSGGSVDGNFTGIPANFGNPVPGIGDTPITASLILVEDDNSEGSTDANDGCDPIVNGAALAGNIAVMRRASCEFSDQALEAQNNGAIGVVIVNSVPSAPFAMTSGSFGSQVSIPAIMVGQSDGEALIEALLGGESLDGNLIMQQEYLLDSSLDNLVVVHEYAHGISARLVAGPFAPNCINNEESMDEGWSDFYGLMFTMTEDDFPEEPRGVVNYLIGESETDGGIRPAPYSTDRDINDLTYGDTLNQDEISVPHGIGTVWATMLWDITWYLIDEYGFDADLYNGTSGNNIAIQLVTDGLKMTSCIPGFEDARNGVIAAIEINSMIPEEDKEEVTCAIWGIFAERGLGLSAEQRLTETRQDQVEAFDAPTFNANLGVCEFPVMLNVDEFVENNFSVFPNPSNGQINVSMRTNLGAGQIQIMDLNGRVVFSQDNLLEGTININANGLSTGVYLLQVSNQDVSEATKLIIK